VYHRRRPRRRREMSLPTGREAQRVRSWGLARKRDDAGRPLGMRGDGEEVARIIDGLLGKHRTGGGVLGNGCEYRPDEKDCQYPSLRANREKKISRY
jgi:hypothetical protein